MSMSYNILWILKVVVSETKDLALPLSEKKLS